MRESPAARSRSAERLCAHYGIATDYDDIWGTRHPVAPEHLVALLREFDVRRPTRRNAARCLECARAAAWQRALPPVGAIDADAALEPDACGCPQRRRAALDGAHRGRHGASGQGRRARLCPSCPHRARRVACASALPDGSRCALPAGLSPPDDRRGRTANAAVVARPSAATAPAALQDGGRVWGPARAALRPALAAQLGHRRFRRPGALLRRRRRARRRHRRAQSAARAVPAQPGARQPLQPVVAPAPQRALHRRRGGARISRDCEPAQRLVRSPDFQARLAALRERRWSTTSAWRRPSSRCCELLFAHFRAQHLGRRRRARGTRRDFRAFRAARGDVAAPPCAVRGAAGALSSPPTPTVWGWPVWPEAYRDPAARGGAALRRRPHAERVELPPVPAVAGLAQLARAGAQCEALGMGVGLYLDLAVSVDRAGSDAWGEQRPASRDGASVGAPPDEFNPNGQGWGLPPLRPDRLRAGALPLLHRRPCAPTCAAPARCASTT